MKLRLDRSSTVPIHQQLLEQIQAALHVGQLRPGDRMPSLREMARRCEVNPKTVLRAYRALQELGILDVRPGSGAVVGGDTIERHDEERALGLLRMARRHRAEALTAGLSPEEHRALLSRLEKNPASQDRHSRLRLVVLECNAEQATVFAREITQRLRVSTFPLVLPAVGPSVEAILRMADIWVTTDFHYQEISQRATEHHRPCLTLRLDPRFHETLLAAARRGSVLMVVHDLSIIPVFRRALVNAGFQSEIIDRIRGVAGSDIQAVQREINRSDAIYVSPLCMEEILPIVPRRAVVQVPRWLIATASIEALRAMILTLPVVPREPKTPAPLQAIHSTAPHTLGTDGSSATVARQAKRRKKTKRN